MRWLYCAQRPEQNLLFGYQHADEVRRQFLIPLWNVYNFFVTYARLDGWEPSSDGFDPANPEGGAPPTSALLDRWIVARINTVVARCTECLEISDAYTATTVVEGFLDDLTNWYVRRSRRRFWKSEHDADKNAAYAALYYVLVRLIRLLAPFTPFVTEVMYQSLVCAVQPTAHGSVHHCSWPAADSSLVDETLMSRMGLARRIASLGLGARGSANIKVRQPLAKTLVYVADAQLAATLDEEIVAIIIDELNVKALELVAEESALVTYRILPDNKALGPRFGARFPSVRAALAAANPQEVVGRVRAGLPVSLPMDGEMVELAPAEVLVQTQPVAGLAVAADKGVTVGVDAVVTPVLRTEGLARELVRRIQTQRKDAGFNIEDRIVTHFLAGDELAGVVGAWADYIKAETLSVELVAGELPRDAYSEEHNVEGAAISLGIRRVSA
jgi:isoleucyl-tRNA synthetase